MEKKRSRFDRLREENATLLPAIRKAQAQAAGSKPVSKAKPVSTPSAPASASGQAPLSDAAAETIARTLKLFLTDPKSHG